MKFSKMCSGWIKKYFLVLGFLISSCAPVVAKFLTVDDETKNLIIDSITLDLISNFALKDTDGSPYLVLYDTMDIVKVNIDVSADGISTLYTYGINVTYESLAGHTGIMVCETLFGVTKTEKKALKASCSASNLSGFFFK